VIHGQLEQVRRAKSGRATSKAYGRHARDACERTAGRSRRSQTRAHASTARARFAPKVFSLTFSALVDSTPFRARPDTRPPVTKTSCGDTFCSHRGRRLSSEPSRSSRSVARDPSRETRADDQRLRARSVGWRSHRCACSINGAQDCFSKPRALARLCEKPMKNWSQPFQDVGIRVPGKQDAGGARMMELTFQEQLLAIHFGHSHVGHDSVAWVPSKLVERSSTTRRE
jgi:hypothetical protein